MTMPRHPHPLIAELAESLAPVQPERSAPGAAFVALAVLLLVAVFAALDGLARLAILAHSPPLWFVAFGLLLVAGTAAASAVLRLASPRVGSRQDGARWSLIALAVLPAGALAAVALSGGWAAMLDDRIGMDCFAKATLGGLAVAAMLVARLRRGAPVSLRAAGLYTGVAAGALGSAAYLLACPVDAIGHLGVWHVLPVLVSALAGSVLVPPLIRW